MPTQNPFYQASWFSWLILIIIAVGLGWFFYGQYYLEPVDWNNSNTENSVIKVTENPDGTKTVRNVREGVEVTVGEEWSVTQHPQEPLSVLYRGEEQPDVDTDLIDGISFSVNKLASSKNLSVEKWLLESSQYKQSEIDEMKRFDIGNYKILLIEQEFDDEGYLPVGINNRRFDYLVIKDDELLDYRCDVVAKISQMNIYQGKCLEILENNL